MLIRLTHWAWAGGPAGSWSSTSVRAQNIQHDAHEETAARESLPAPSHHGGCHQASFSVLRKAWRLSPEGGLNPGLIIKSGALRSHNYSELIHIKMQRLEAFLECQGIFLQTVPNSCCLFLFVSLTTALKSGVGGELHFSQWSRVNLGGENSESQHRDLQCRFQARNRNADKRSF